MKKVMIALVLAVFTALPVLATESSFALGVWYDCPENIGTTDVEGLCVGVPLIANGEVEGASVALIGNRSREVSGLQFALIGFNFAESLYGIQLGLLNFQGGQHDDFTAQLGFYNQAEENGLQLGFINNSRNNATFQLGFININKRGFFPVMLLVNFGSDLFD